MNDLSIEKLPTRTPIVFDLQLFAETDEEKAARDKREADDKAAADKKKADEEASAKKREEEERARDQDDLSKMTAVELVNYAKQLRSQSAGYRTRAKNLETELTEAKGKLDGIEREKLEADKKFQEIAASEKAAREKADKDRDEARKRADSVAVMSEVREAAREAGLRNSKILAKLDISGITLNDDGTVDPQQLAKFIRETKAEYPELFAPPVDKDGKTEEQKREDERKAQEQRDKDEQQRRKDDNDRRRRPALDDKGAPINWAGLTPEQFAAEEAKLLSGTGSRV